jgi:hypothetical protein
MEGMGRFFRKGETDLAGQYQQDPSESRNVK